MKGLCKVCSGINKVVKTKFMQPVHTINSENGHLNLEQLDLYNMEKLYVFLLESEKESHVKIPEQFFYRLTDLFLSARVHLDSIKIISIKSHIDDGRINRFLLTTKNIFIEIIYIFLELGIELPKEVKRLAQD